MWLQKMVQAQHAAWTLSYRQKGLSFFQNKARQVDASPLNRKTGIERPFFRGCQISQISSTISYKSDNTVRCHC
jgi:hypothetical protein